MRSERTYYLLIGALALILASGPYLYGALHTPPGSVYSGLTSNIDDCLVYFSWINENASGHVLHRNLFSTEAQSPKLFYAWFALLGLFAKFLPTVAVFHLARVFGGAALLVAVIKLLQETVESERARRIAYGFVCFGAGFGWIFGGFDPAKGFTLQPIDLFQPEAIPFLSLYYSPLFAPMTALMVVFLTALVRAGRTGKLRDAVPAAISGLILGNSHTYDVVHLLAVAFVWRLVETVVARRFVLAKWLPLVVGGLGALPTTAYTAWASKVDPLFRARAWTNEGTYTPALWWVLLGFGLPLVFGVVALYKEKSTPALRLLAVWGIVGVLVAYLPFPWQRKLLMGAYLPWCALGGIGLAILSQRLSGDFPKIVAFLGVLFAVPSNILYLLTDIGRLDSNSGTTAHRPYLSAEESKALEWLRTHGTTTDAVLVSHDPSSLKRFPNRYQPSLSCYVAGVAEKIVYNGHWSETLAYPKKDNAAFQFFKNTMDDTDRERFLRENGVRYVLYENSLADGALSDDYTPVAWTEGRQPGFLKPVYTSNSLTIFAVVP